MPAAGAGLHAWPRPKAENERRGAAFLHSDVGGGREAEVAPPLWNMVRRFLKKKKKSDTWVGAVTRGCDPGDSGG